MFGMSVSYTVGAPPNLFLQVCDRLPTYHAPNLPIWYKYTLPSSRYPHPSTTKIHS